MGGNDQNYHGHLNSSNPATRQSYYNGTMGIRMKESPNWLRK